MPQKFNPFSDKHVAEMGQTNNDGLKPVALKLYEHLQNGNTVNFVTARDLGITQLDKHIAEITGAAKIYSRVIRIQNIQCKEYSLRPFE